MAAETVLSQIATITGVTGLTDEAALVTNGNLVVASRILVLRRGAEKRPFIFLALGSGGCGPLVLAVLAFDAPLNADFIFWVFLPPWLVRRF